MSNYGDVTSDVFVFSISEGNGTYFLPFLVTVGPVYLVYILPSSLSA